MKKNQVGKLRFIDLYSNEDIKEKENFKKFADIFELKKNLGDNFEVIGSVNGMEPIFLINRENQNYITVLELSQNKLLTISLSRIQFDEIVNEINKIWKNNNDQMFLEKNKKNMELFKQFKKYVTSIDGIESWYWIDFAFKELDIRYEV